MTDKTEKIFGVFYTPHNIWGGTSVTVLATVHRTEAGALAKSKELAAKHGERYHGEMQGSYSVSEFTLQD